MSDVHRIAAGGVVLDAERVLLVRYSSSTLASYLVCPGGRVEGSESLTKAVEREVLEETGVSVSPSKLLVVEDLVTSTYRMVKFWFLCGVTGGQVSQTAGAVQEGIDEVRWYTRKELADETVFPAVVRECDWSKLYTSDWRPNIDGPRVASF